MIILDVMIIINPIPTRLCHVIYGCGDKNYPWLVGIGLIIQKMLWLSRIKDLKNTKTILRGIWNDQNYHIQIWLVL